jgi:hypothetical protein
VLDAVFPVTAKIIKPKTVFIRIIFIHLKKLQLSPLFRIDNAFKNRMLDSLPITKTCLGYSAQSPPTFGCGCCDIIAYQDEHKIICLLLPGSRRYFSAR